MKTDLEQMDENRVSRELSRYVESKFTFRRDHVKFYSDAVICEDWSSFSRRMIHFANCKFIKCNFNSTGFTGGIFINCIFEDSQLNSTIFDECLFFNCCFNSLVIKSASFCKAEFHKSNFHNSELHECFFTEVLFSDTTIHSTDIIDIIWENAKFKNAKFIDCNLLNLNFNFTFFNNIKFENTRTCFQLFPFIFGGIDYVLNSQDSLYLETVHPKYSNKLMPVQDYKEIINSMLYFYQETDNFFPVANILLSNGKIEEGVHSIMRGIDFWAKLQNYKIIYYLCELANEYDLPISYRASIWKKIQKTEQSMTYGISKELSDRWASFRWKIRDNLLKSKSVPYLEIQFTTLIESSDYAGLCLFMQKVENTFKAKEVYHCLEVRHNSPQDLVYTILGNPELLIQVTIEIASLFLTGVQIFTNIAALKEKKKPKDSMYNVENVDAPTINNNQNMSQIINITIIANNMANTTNIYNLNDLDK